MTGRDKLYRSLNLFGDQKENRKNYISGILGFIINGIQTVEVANRPGYVYVRLRDNISEVIQAYNAVVSPVYGLPVVVTRDSLDSTRYIIVEREAARYSNWQTVSPYLAKHGNQHSFDPETGGGGDVVWIFGRQFMPLALTPSGSSGAGGVIIEDSTYYWQGSWRYAGNTGTPSLLLAKPTNNQARLLLVYLDSSGNPALVTGTLFSASLTGTSQILPYIPSLPTTQGIPLGAVRLVSGTSRIIWDNIYDLRPFIVGDSFIPTGSNSYAPDNASYVTLTGDGTLTAERILTAGSDVSLVDAGAGSTVTVGVQTGTFARANHNHQLWYLNVYDDGVFKGTGTVLSFNNNLSVIASGTSIFVDATSGGGGGGNPIIYDDGVFKGTGTYISFNDNLTVIASGTSIFINASGGGGGGGSVTIYSDHVYKVSGTSLDFGQGISVVITGSSAFVDWDWPDWKRTVLVDEFTGGASSSAGHIGDLSWLLPAGSIIAASGSSNHVGVFNFNSSNNNGTIGRLILSMISATPQCDPADINYIGWIVRPTTGLSAGPTGSARFGLMFDPLASRNTGQGIYWSCDPQASAGMTGTWASVTRDGSGITRTDSNYQYTVNNWYLLEMKRNESSWEFYINGDLHSTHATNIPTSPQYIMAGVELLSNSTARGVDVDWFGLKTRDFTQRWT